MGPLDAIKTCLAKSFQFKGRASRAEFWWFIALAWMAVTAATFADQILFPIGLGQKPGVPAYIIAPILPTPLTFLTAAIAIPASITVSVRRLHDAGMSGALVLISVLMMLGYGATYRWTFSATSVVSDDPFASVETLTSNFDVTADRLQTTSPFLRFASWLIMALQMAILLLCIRPSKLSLNKYGPNPNEVPQ